MTMKKDLKQVIIPTVTEREENIFKTYDIYSRLLKDNIIFLGDSIDDVVANLVVAQLLFLEQQDAKQDIFLYINSPGGSVSAGWAIYDTMNYIKPDVHTICVGQASSMGAFLLANGASKKRSALPHTRIMIHQPLVDGLGGQVTDVEIATKQLQRSKKQLTEALAKNTGQPTDKLAADMERDHWLTPQEAMKYGLVDNILEKRP